MDTDENDLGGGGTFDDENQNGRKTSTEREKIVSEEDKDFMKAFDALVAESVAVSRLCLVFTVKISYCLKLATY